jgi:hypothetical protein
MRLKYLFLNIFIFKIYADNSINYNNIIENVSIVSQEEDNIKIKCQEIINNIKLKEEVLNNKICDQNIFDYEKDFYRAALPFARNMKEEINQLNISKEEYNNDIFIILNKINNIFEFQKDVIGAPTYRLGDNIQKIYTLMQLDGSLLFLLSKLQIFLIIPRYLKIFDEKLIRLVDQIEKDIQEKFIDQIEKKINKGISSIDKEIDKKIVSLNEEVDKKMVLFNEQIAKYIKEENKKIDNKIYLALESISIISISFILALCINNIYNRFIDNFNNNNNFNKYENIIKKNNIYSFIKDNITKFIDLGVVIIGSYYILQAPKKLQLIWKEK